jgi:hypothetical protein
MRSRERSGVSIVAVRYFFDVHLFMRIERRRDTGEAVVARFMQASKAHRAICPRFLHPGDRESISGSWLHPGGVFLRAIQKCS